MESPGHDHYYDDDIDDVSDEKYNHRDLHDLHLSILGILCIGSSCVGDAALARSRASAPVSHKLLQIVIVIILIKIIIVIVIIVIVIRRLKKRVSNAYI